MKSFLETLRKLWADPMGKIGMIGVFLLIVMAIFAPMLAPYPYDQIGMRFHPGGRHRRGHRRRMRLSVGPGGRLF